MSLSRPCPTSPTGQMCFDCPKVERKWNLDELLPDLAREKGNKSLTATEICWLLLLLNGTDFGEIVKRFNYQPSIKSRFSQTIYSYVKSLTQREEIKHWACIPLYLEKYRKNPCEASRKTTKFYIEIKGDYDRENFNKKINLLKQVHGVDSLQIYKIYQHDTIDE